jgi:hypothetical protein
VTRTRALLLAGVVLAAAACSETTRVSGGAPATLSLTQTASSASLVSPVASDSGFPSPPGVIRREWVDSLIVYVGGVALHPRFFGPDSLRADSGRSFPWDDSLGGMREPFGPGGPGRMGRPGRPGGPGGMEGPGGPGRPMPPDSLRPYHIWDELAVVSGGRVDLLHLPLEGSAGIVVATGSVTPGDYRGVRLLLDSAYIVLNTAVVSPSGDTIPVGWVRVTGFPPMGVMIPVTVTVPESGGDIAIVFDHARTFAAAMVTPRNEVVLLPAMRRGPPFVRP